MDTPTVDNTSSASSSSSSSTLPSNTLDKNSFLKLLVAELQNQDPTSTQDPNQMVQQMASFSTLEAQQNTNSLLTSIQGQNNAIFEAQSAGLIGKKVNVATNTFGLVNGTANIDVNMPKAGLALLTIKNSSGAVVATIGPGAVSAGDNPITWTGKDSSGNQVADGTYTVSVSAVTASGDSITGTTSTQATVTDVSFQDGQVYVIANGNKYPLSNVSRISS
jgi:flagellar basal-body rod modification protein FlgD